MSNWTEHKPTQEDVSPIGDNLWCEILMLDGEVFEGFAYTFSWNDLGDWGGNIIAYRLPQLVEAEKTVKIHEEATPSPRNYINQITAWRIGMINQRCIYVMAQRFIGVLYFYGLCAGKMFLLMPHIPYSTVNTNLQT